jgi:hypothetical protein
MHDAAEFMLGWDCIAPLKAELGEPFRILDARLQAAVDARYRLPAWTPEACAKHKRADRLAAASEAIHVVGWSLTDLRRTLGIEIAPLLDDPLAPRGFAPSRAVAAARGAEAVHAAPASAPPRPSILPRRARADGCMRGRRPLSLG